MTLFMTNLDCNCKPTKYIKRTYKHMRLLGESVSVNMNVYKNYIFKIYMLLKTKVHQLQEDAGESPL